MLVNFGGFVPLSTVDWRGRAVCTIFFRGCSARCYYCHNRHLQQGENHVPVENILALIDEARMLVSGAVFSGGECTEQPRALHRLIGACKTRGMGVGIHTNGAYPDTCRTLIGEVDKVSLDIKASWENYPSVTGVNIADQVTESFAVFHEAQRSGLLPEFEVVHTLFRGHEADVREVAAAVDDVDLVLQQGIWGRDSPLSLAEIQRVADGLGRPVKIRTRETGEVLYQNGVFTVSGSMQATDPKRLLAYYKSGVPRGE